ncbi:MAG: polysaccharide deacetylase family protein [Rhodobacteraceae bacterium]|nr:polysaccharide deacetylase family protein [Paracoccaceae bacterium]
MAMTPVPSRPALTTVMYHYVRPVAASTFPRLPALELADFLGQLDHLQAHYTLLSPHTFLQALEAGEPLPPRACLLTFDDGYADHYRHVFPHLVDRGLSGLFFTPKSSLIDRHLLEVNQIQFTLASNPQPKALADEVDSLLRSIWVTDPAPLRATHFAPNRFDGPEVAYVKRLLQHALPADVRSQLAARLFARHVSTDPQAFAEDLYLTPAQAQEMLAAGMVFGGHGDRHLWHGLASPEDLAAEVAGSVAALAAIGVSPQSACYCYPFGSQTEAVRQSVADAGFRAGFTVVPELWLPGSDPFQITRLDTKDLPHRPMQEDPWLVRALDAQALSGAGG